MTPYLLNICCSVAVLRSHYTAWFKSTDIFDTFWLCWYYTWTNLDDVYPD